MPRHVRTMAAETARVRLENMAQTHEFGLSEEWVRVLRRRVLLVVAGCFLLMQGGILVVLYMGNVFFAIVADVQLVLVGGGVALLAPPILSRQSKSVFVRIQKDRLRHHTPLGDKEIALREVRSVTRTVDEEGRTIRLKVVDAQGNVTRLVGFDEMDTLHDLSLRYVPPGLESMESEGKKDRSFLYGAVIVTLFVAGLFPLLMLGRRHLSDPQLILIFGFLAAVLSGAVLPLLLRNYGMKGPKARRTYLFYALEALAAVVFAVMAAWIVASVR